LTNKSKITKKKIVRHCDWMKQDPLPFPIFRKETIVRVFMGAGWKIGTVEYSAKDSCVVYLKQTQQRVRVYDRRNIKENSK
jgi:hypothetical protein